MRSRKWASHDWMSQRRIANGGLLHARMQTRFSQTCAGRPMDWVPSTCRNCQASPRLWPTLTSGLYDDRESFWRERLRGVSDELAVWIRDLARIQDSLDEHLRKVRIDIDRELRRTRPRRGQATGDSGDWSAGFLAAKLRSQPRATRKELRTLEQAFRDALKERKALVQQQRQAFDIVLRDVERMFGGSIRARRVDDGDGRPLAKFLVDLKQRGHHAVVGTTWPTRAGRRRKHWSSGWIACRPQPPAHLPRRA